LAILIMTELNSYRQLPAVLVPGLIGTAHRVYTHTSRTHESVTLKFLNGATL
jgi:hypothetical protein